MHVSLESQAAFWKSQGRLCLGGVAIIREFITCKLRYDCLCSLINMLFEAQEVDCLGRDAIGHGLLELLLAAHIVVGYNVSCQFQDAHE